MTSNDSLQHLTCEHNDSLKLNSQSTYSHVKRNITFNNRRFYSKPMIEKLQFQSFSSSRFSYCFMSFVVNAFGSA